MASGHPLGAASGRNLPSGRALTPQASLLDRATDLLTCDQRRSRSRLAPLATAPAPEERRSERTPVLAQASVAKTFLIIDMGQPYDLRSEGGP